MPGEAGLLRNVLCGAYYTMERRRDENLAADDTCPSCRMAKETPMHRFWECEANKGIEWEESDHEEESDEVEGGEREV